MAFILYSSGLLGYQTNVDKYGTFDVGEAYAAAGNINGLPANPKLMYSAGMHTPLAGWGWWAPYQEAVSDGYVLHKPDGTLCQASSQYGLDVGDPAMQQDWIRGMRQKMAQYPAIDGFYIDGVNRQVQAWCGGSFPQEYPTLAAWDAAMKEWAQVVGTTARNEGVYLLASAGGYCPSCGDPITSTEYWFGQIAPYFPALFTEYQVTHSVSSRLASMGPAWDQQWDRKVALQTLANSLGVDFYTLDIWDNADVLGKVYTRASFLINWDGKGGGHFNSLRCGYACGDQWPPGEAAYDVGQPVSAKVQVGVGWQREFTLAHVLINPDPAVSQTFSVGGQSITVAPVTARIIGK
jgi:hypothetical protein